MTGFTPGSSGFGSDRSANCATTTSLFLSFHNDKCSVLFDTKSKKRRFEPSIDIFVYSRSWYHKHILKYCSYSTLKKHSDWLKEVTWLATANHRALFQHTLKNPIICLQCQLLYKQFQPNFLKGEFVFALQIYLFGE